MKANWERGGILGCLVACLSATTAGCSDGEDGGGAPPPPTDMERGTTAATLQDTCGVAPWMDDGLSVFSSLGVMLSAFPALQKRVVDCNLAAHDCKEVRACEVLRVADYVPYEDLHLPECGSERTDHCEGNVVKYCVADDGDYETYYQASFDCALAGATCVEWQTDSGGPRADCQAPPLHCEGPKTAYCDGTRAVRCEEAGPSILSPWVYDCADAFGSHCIEYTSDVECEGPATGEEDCDDGIDGDGDGKVDCDDDDCHCN